MRLWSVFLKTLREMSRDPWMLGLTMAFAPFFVFAYWIWFQGGGSTVYPIALLNLDQGAQQADGQMLQAGLEIPKAIDAITYGDGKPLLKALPVQTQAEAEALIKNRSATAFLVIPEDFSRAVLALQNGDRAVSTQITFGGDLANPYYMVGVNLALTAADGYVQQASGQNPILNYVEKPLGLSGARSEFETYVPGTLIFAVILLIFLASMTVAREIETGALRRLQLTRLSAFELLGGISAALTLVGVAAIGLALGVALLLGFHSQGPVWLALLVGAFTSLAVIGIGMLVASLARSVSQAFVVANFPLGLMMFFSGVIFPMPKVALFTLFGHAISLFDILPPTHAVNALNKVLTMGAGLGDVTYELGALVCLSLLYYIGGALLFQRVHMRGG